MDDSLRRTLRDLGAFFASARVSYAVIGGIAVSFRGEPRFTADIDVVAGMDCDAAIALLGSADRARFAPLFPDAEDVVRTAFILPLRHRETLVTVDVSIGLTGYERRVIARAPRERVADLLVPVATAEDLIVMKIFAGRPRDAEDARGIVLRCGEAIDWDYVLETGRQLGEAVSQDLLTPLRKLRGPDEG